MRKFNRTSQAPMEYVLVATGNQSLATGALVSGGNSVNIADGQLGVLSTDVTGTNLANNFITAGADTSGVKSVKIVRGTPNSSNLSAVSPFNLNDQAYLKTADIDPSKIVEVSTTLPEVATYSSNYLSGFTAPTVALDYDLTIVLESTQTDIDYNRKRANINTFSVGMPAVAPTDITDYFLQNVALDANKQGIWRNPTGKPFIVFGIDSTPASIAAGSFVVGQTYTIDTVGTTDFTLIGASANTIGVTFIATGVGAGTGTALVGVTLGEIIAGDSIPYMTADGVQSTFVVDIPFVQAMNNAITGTAALSTAGIVNLGAITPGTAATVDSLLVVGLNDNTAVIFDEETRNKVRIEAGSTLAHTLTVTSTSKDWVGTGKQWQIQWKRRYGKQHAFENWYSSDLTGSVTTAPSYITADESTLYTSTLIVWNSVETHSSNYDKVIPHRLSILLPAAISNPTADADTGYTVATTATTTATELNAALGAWLLDAYNSWSNHKYYQAATPAAPFV